jgi:hypothetical protein
LHSIPFGKAPLSQQNDVDDSENTTSGNQEAVKDIPQRNLNIVICGILSKYSSRDATYKEKQAINLLSYHLQKYASDINCSLCFVNSPADEEDNDDEKDENDSERLEVRSDALRPKGMPVQEFSHVLKRICMGRHATTGKDSMENEFNEDNTEKDPNDEKTAIYYPFEYDVDLINSVLLRGAGCPGVWNANTDDLWVALPPASSSGNIVSTIDDNTSVSEKRGGDEEWLNKLADSVSAYIGAVGGTDASSILSPTSASISTSNGTPKVTKKRVVKKKSSGDKGDVQDFFASLINK